jgi:exopolysaccharide production protein ExoZ
MNQEAECDADSRDRFIINATQDCRRLTGVLLQGMLVARPLDGTSRQFLSIQYLRAFAALGVVIYHVSPADHPIMVGNAGVDIFFVISGFIMWNITAERPTSPSAFLKNRLIRIAPMYWLITALLVAGAVGFPKLFPNLKIDIPYVVGSFLFVPMRPPGSLETGPIWPVLVQGWTLSCEMFFYALFSMCLFLKPSWRLAGLSLALVGCVAAGLFYNGSNAIVLRLTEPIFLEFLAGVLLGVCVQRNLLPSRQWGYWLAGLAIILLFGLAMISVTQPRLIAWGLPAIMLVAGALILEAAGGVPHLRLLRLIGDSSYSLYLTHGLVLSVLGKVMVHSWLFSLAGIFLATGVGIVFWRLLEMPLTNTLRKLLAKPQTDRIGSQALQS